MSVNIDLFMQDDSNSFFRVSFVRVTVPPSNPGNVKDIKDHIMETQKLNNLYSDFVVQKKGVYQALEDTDEVKAGEHLQACLIRELDGDENTSANFCSDKSVYILTGTNWEFETISIGNEQAGIVIKTSKRNKCMQPVEHKFAIFDKKPDDDNYWRAERYTLDKEYENHNIQITHSSYRGITQRTVQVEGGPTLQLDGIIKTFSRKKEAERKEVIASLVTAGASLFAVPVAVVIITAAPVVAPTAAAAAGVTATVAVANAGFKAFQNKDSLR